MIAKILIAKLASDAGFDLEFGEQSGWLQFGLAGSDLRIWLQSLSRDVLVCFSRQDITREIGASTAWSGALPAGVQQARQIADADQLVSILSRARVLDRTLPQALLNEYQATISKIETTEALAVVTQRRGQEIFRRGLMEYWQGRCAITGLAVAELLRASHAKAWKDSNDSERLDVHNGLLLVAHLDAAFDQGLICVARDGSVLVSPLLDEHASKILGLHQPAIVRGLKESHEPYLEWHRSKVFRRELV